MTGKYLNDPDAPSIHTHTLSINGMVNGESPNLPTNKLPIPATKIVESTDIKMIGPTTCGI